MLTTAAIMVCTFCALCLFSTELVYTSFRFQSGKFGLRDEHASWRDDSSEVSDEGYKSQGNTASHSLPRTRKPTIRRSLEMDTVDMLGVWEDPLLYKKKNFGIQNFNVVSLI